MKKWILLVFTVILFAFSAKAQIFRANAIVGMNVSQVNGDETYGFKKFGLNVGGGVEMPLGKNFLTSFEILYSQKGAYQKAFRPDSAIDGMYRLKLNYAEIPILIHYTDHKAAAIGLGFAWGRLVGTPIETEQRYTRDFEDLDTVYRKNEFSIIGDGKLRLYKNLKLNVRYQYSLAPIATRWQIDSASGKKIVRDQYSSLWSLRLIWTFNEPTLEPDAKKKKTTSYY